MTSQIKLGEFILEEDGYRNNDWKQVSLLDTVKLGNFAWKSPRNFFIRLVPLCEKYFYVPALETLKEYLEKRDGKDFELVILEPEQKYLSQKVREKIQKYNAGCDGIATGSVTDETKISVPARELTITRINRKELEDELESWKLNMKSPYIKEKKKKGNCIPCIISSIVEANKPEDEADGMAREEKRRRIEGTAKLEIALGSGTDTLVLPVKPKGEGEFALTYQTKACVHGAVLYKVLPLEVGPTGRITPTEDSKGFIEERIVSDSDGMCGQFACVGEGPTLQSNLKDIEELLQPIVDNQTVADAFKATSIVDIHYLCRLFEHVQDCPDDWNESDKKMSPNCRDILLFANFQHKESGGLILKEKFQCHKSLTGSYYLTAILAEVPTTIRQLISKFTVNLFPLLRGILLETPLSEMVIDDGILNCTYAMQLLEMLGIRVNGSAVVGIPESLELLANVVWLAMLYGSPTRAIQQ